MPILFPMSSIFGPFCIMIELFSVLQFVSVNSSRNDMFLIAQLIAFSSSIDQLHWYREQTLSFDRKITLEYAPVSYAVVHVGNYLYNEGLAPAHFLKKCVWISSICSPSIYILKAIHKLVASFATFSRAASKTLSWTRTMILGKIRTNSKIGKWTDKSTTVVARIVIDTFIFFPMWAYTFWAEIREILLEDVSCLSSHSSEFVHSSGREKALQINEIK